MTHGQVALTPSVQAVVFTRLTGRLSPNRGWHRKSPPNHDAGNGVVSRGPNPSLG